MNMCPNLSGYQDRETLIVISLAVFDINIHIKNSCVSGYLLLDTAILMIIFVII